MLKVGANVNVASSSKPLLEMECVICAQLQTLFITKIGKSFRTISISNREIITWPYHWIGNNWQRLTNWLAGCKHVYCISCLRQYVDEKLVPASSSMKCPSKDCNESFDVEQLEELLHPVGLEIPKTPKEEFTIESATLRVYCPFEDCSAFTCFSGKPSHEPKFMRCWNCHRGFCAKCNTPCSKSVLCKCSASQSHNKIVVDLSKKNSKTSISFSRMVKHMWSCYHVNSP